MLVFTALNLIVLVWCYKGHLACENDKSDSKPLRDNCLTYQNLVHCC